MDSVFIFYFHQNVFEINYKLVTTINKLFLLSVNFENFQVHYEQKFYAAKQINIKYVS